MYTCKICNMHVKKIASHVRSAHKLNPQDYYNNYVKTFDNEGICPVCGKSTVFLGITHGYRKHCSVNCSSLDKNVQAKARATNMELYGVEHNWNNGPLREHYKQTMVNKYGVDHNWKSSELRSKEKFKLSDLEQLFTDCLTKANINHKFGYFDEKRYPYVCDFYLYDYDMFIEIHGSPFHNGRIFDPNNDKDIECLNDYKEKAKTSSWYESIVRVWQSDYIKYKTALENNLHYVILWNKKDIYDFISNLPSIKNQ